MIDTDGSGGEQIVFRRPASGVHVEGMAWSADGGALYVSLMETTFKDGRFLSQTLNLERLDLATGERTTLVADAAYPSVSPDGSRIAYITFAAGDDPGGIWVARADGSDRRLIVPTAGRFVVITHPRFSSDGSTIAFSAATYASSRDLRPGGPPDGKRIAIIATGGLYVTNAAGGEPRKLGLGATLAQLDWR